MNTMDKNFIIQSIIGAVILLICMAAAFWVFCAIMIGLDHVFGDGSMTESLGLDHVYHLWMK